jgi:hypothetical protein
VEVVILVTFGKAPSKMVVMLSPMITVSVQLTPLQYAQVVMSVSRFVHVSNSRMQAADAGAEHSGHT